MNQQEVGEGVVSEITPHISALTCEILVSTVDNGPIFAPYHIILWTLGGSVVEWLVCWTPVQKSPGSNRSRDAVR